MLHEKLFYVKQKKVDVARKSVSRRQKQDDAAQINYFLLKKVIIFFLNGAPYKPILIFFAEGEQQMDFKRRNFVFLKNSQIYICLWRFVLMIAYNLLTEKKYFWKI